MSILFLIPARGGSKRLAGKNLKKLAGIPLVAWAIRRAQGAARLLGGEHRVVVSTDSEEIAAVSREWGAEVVMRPAELATDTASSESVILHARRRYPDEKMLTLVQPTTPLATADDVVRTISRAEALPGMVATATEDGQRANGAAYACWGLLADQALSYQPLAYEPMPASRSVDIDTEDDWHVAEALLAVRPLAPFAINERQIGTGHPCFVIAEAGINHNGNVETAHRLVDAAADAGADAVKFQTFIPEELAEPGPHRDLLARVNLSREAYPGLKKRAEDRGLVFLSSAFDCDSVDFLDKLGVPAFKVPSGEIINLPLLRHIASKGKPVILSTGMSTMVEVARGVDALTGVPLALLHCVSEYPVEDEESAHLVHIETMRQAFGVPVGWSDHTGGAETAITAAALGASIIEAHISNGVDIDGPDGACSLFPQEFACLVEEVQNIDRRLGGGEKGPTYGELQTAKTARRRDGLRRDAP